MKRHLLPAVAMLIGALLPAAAADNTAVYLARTEHSSATEITTSTLVQGGNIAAIRLPAQSVSVSFWLKWDRAADNSSSDATSGDRGNTPVFSVRQEKHDTAWALITRDGALPADERWHYHLITLARSNTTAIVSHYVDGVQTATFARSQSGITNAMCLSIGAEMGLVGTDEADIRWRSTDQNLILDDVTIWSGVSQAILDKFTTVADFGMARFDPADADITHYYNCDNTKGAPLILTADRVITPGSSPPASWYDQIGEAVVSFPAATDPRRRMIQVNVTSAYGGNFISPPPGLSLLPYDGTSQSFVEFTAPEFVYLDRYGVELGSSDSPDLYDWLDKAFYRARNVGYAIRLGGRSDVVGSARAFAQPMTDDLDISWKWEIEHAIIVESATSRLQDSGLTDALGNPALSEDGSNVPMILGRNWVKPGTIVRAAMDGIVFSDTNATEPNISFRMTGYRVENASASSGGGDRHVVLSGRGDYLRSDMNSSRFGTGHSFALEFWAQREGRGTGGPESIVAIDSMWVGFDTENTLRFGATNDQETITLPGMDLGEDWHHWVYQFDSASGVVSIHLDTESIYSSGPTTNRWNFSTIKSVLIGAMLDGSGNASNYFAGGVNNLRLWNKSLTKAEIQAASRTNRFGPGQSNLVMEVTFDEVVADFGAAAHFADNDDSLFLDSPITLADSYTLEAMILLPIPATSADGDRLPFLASESLSNIGSPVAFNAAGDLLSVNGDVEAPAGFNISALPGGWHRFTAVVEGNRITHYVDGARVGAVDLPLTRRLISVGGSGTGTQCGWVDDIRVWQRARAADEIQSDWRRPLTLPQSGLVAYYTFDNGTPVNVVGGGHNGAFDNGALAGAPPGGTGPSVYSEEGNGFRFVLHNFDPLFPEGVSWERKQAVLFPTLTRAERAPVNRVNTDSMVVNDWLRIEWTWHRTFRLQVEVADNAFAALPFIVNEDVVHSGVDAMKNLWVKELSTVTVGTQYRVDGGCFTLDPTNGVSAQQDAFRAITMDSLEDGTFNGKVTRQFTFAGMTGPGKLMFKYSPTVYRAEVAIGMGFDASSPAAVASQLTPDLCGPGARLAVGANGGPSEVIPPPLTGGATGVGDLWVWDQVNSVFHPLAPGVFTLTWPDAVLPGVSYTIEITAAFPADTVTINNRENDDGTRQNPPSYQTDVVFPAVSDAFPASPGAHYTYVYSSDPSQTPPVALDPRSDDRWWYQRTAYAESLAMTSDTTTRRFSSTAGGRAVILYSYRSDPEEIATGDATREGFLPRVISSVPFESRAQPEPRMSVGEDDRRVLWIDGTEQLYAATQNAGGYFAVGSDYPWSWESWVKLDDLTESGSEADRILFQIEARSVSDLLQFGVRGNSNTNNPGGLFVSRQPTAGGAETYTFELPEVSLDANWHHLAVTYDRSALRVFRDGVLVGERPGSPFPYTHAEAVDAGGGNDQQFHHSYGYSPQETNSWLRGGFDNLRFWGHGLAADEVRLAMRSRISSSFLPNFSFSFDRGTSGDHILKDDDYTYPAGGDLLVVSAAGAANPSPEKVLRAPSADAWPEVATKIMSRLDTAGFGTGYLLNELSNYNPHLYNRRADVGEWGPVYPVNWSGLFKAGNRALRLVYYENLGAGLADPGQNLHPDVAWPYVVVEYDNVTFPLRGVHKDKRIYIASRLGSEGVDANGVDQEIFDPARYRSLIVYSQPDPGLAGYNPNEEHALIAPSIKAQLVGDPSFDMNQGAAFALQNSLNRADQSKPSLYTSEPWVLVEFDDLATRETEMAAYRVELTRAGSELFPAVDPETRLPVDAGGNPVPQPSDPTYDFIYRAFPGDPVIAPYPLNLVVGNSVMTFDVGADSHQLSSGEYQRTLWRDKNGVPWVVSGDSEFIYRFWYPMRDDFWAAPIGVPPPNTGDPVAWLPEGTEFLASQTPLPKPRTVVFETFWRTDYAVLKRGESLTYAGGENRADHPLAAGLPGVVGWQSANLVFDSRTPSMRFTSLSEVANYSARVVRPLEAYTQPLQQSILASIRDAQGMPLTPASRDRVQVVGERWHFKELAGSLQRRFYFDSLANELVYRGRLADREGGDPDLTSTPVSLSILEPNVLSPDDYEALLALGNGNAEWKEAVEGIYLESQNPAGVRVGAADPASAESPVFLAGVQNGAFTQVTARLSGGTWQLATNTLENAFVPLDSLGTGAAVVPHPALLDHPVEEPLYLTLVENNHELASGAVTLHIIRIGDERFRGAIGIVESQNVFDEKINLRHTADFGGNTGEAYYQWWVRDAAPLDDVLLPGQETAWQLYQQGPGLNQIEFKGRPDIMLADKLFYVRYGTREELDAIPGNNTANGTVSSASWRLVDPNDWSATYAHEPGEPVPFQWAGAANSPQLQADGSRRFLPQLVMGWVKRVLDRVNPYEARFSQTFSGDSPATFSSMIQEAGKPYNGPVALNSDKNSLENVGLIELYETVLDRARNLTLEIPGASTPGTDQALLLAATRLAVLYEVLASEAYADAQNPALPVREGPLALANTHVHAFQNQVASLLEEELALLRGTDFLKAYPAFNRLFWNYVKGLGEAAYNLNYAISDANQDGMINEFDAAILYPQGHGDAWGHYLSSSRMHYDLLRHTAFDWDALPELYALLDNVIPADFLDERTFSRIAAAKARTGAEIARATYRAAYTADPDGQWQGYTDVADPARAWGVSEWSKRAGQGALFDWFVGNALVPAEAPADSEDLERIDRIACRLELGEIAAALTKIQSTLDDANTGNNPLGLSGDALNFGLDPVLDGTSWERRTHFEQAYDSAALAAQNAVTSLGFASEAEFQLRATAASERDLALDALSQDLDYRDRLIAIYGTPYEGTIGPGKIYDEGYSGPDTLLYMYVDRTDLKDFTPGPDSRYTELTNSLQSLSRNWSALDSGLSLLLGGRDSTKKVLELFDDFYITLPWEELELGSAGESGDEENVIRIAAPVISTGSYAFQAPDDWGARRAPGQIQILINQLLAAEHERDLALEAYNEFVRSVSIKQERLELQLRRLQASADSRDNAQGTLAALDSLGIFFETVAKTAEALATDTWREALAVGSTFPYIVGAMANDTFSAARGAAEQAGVIGSSKSGYVALAFSIAGSLNEVTKAVIERLAEGDRDRVEDYDELLEMLSEFALEVSEEERMRAPIVTALQQMDMIAQQIRSLQAEGQRIQNERAAFNMVLAANAQRNRYQDMVTRLTRNDALGRYQNAFDNALRFVWLAARAYDYETSLSPGDPAAATTFLEEIVRTRQLGAWQDGEPRIGNGGLAEILAQLMGNFQALRGQIGLNNPQHETGDLSLRREHFRILLDSASDSRWRQTLLAARVDDLWKVPEFVHFCRPFAARDQGPQPGLVIEFATSIQSGENVFGRPLAGGDNAYSTASYATKIHSAGAWFEGYDPSRLSGTPRVYLIPAGNDVLRIANSPEPQIRIWSIVEQRIPVPFLINRERLADPNFIPSIDSLNGSFAPIRRFGDFRAYYSASGQAPDLGEVPKDARLFGRSVWNTRWLLIIPGATLGSDPSASLDAFINQVTDIRLLFDTYSNPGI